MRKSVEYYRDNEGRLRFSNSGKLVKHKIKAEISYEWRPVKADKNKDYFFPQEITPYMKKEYNKQHVYRWNIYKKTPEDSKIIYVGETVKLCPDRIKGFLKPGPSQKTNERLNDDFKGYLERKYQIRLEVCTFSKIMLCHREITANDLKRMHIRKLVEAMLIENYLIKGFEILNLGVQVA